LFFERRNGLIGRYTVMAGLVPAIHVLLEDGLQDVDARDKRGHDACAGVLGLTCSI
jgi:hypothetical protein